MLKILEIQKENVEKCVESVENIEKLANSGGA